MKHTTNITTKEDRYGFRYFVFDNKHKVPAEIAGLADGGDKWISQIELMCKSCNTPHIVKNMFMGGQFCETCFYQEQE